MSEIRCFYLDSRWTQRNNNGSFSLILDEQIEVPNSHVLYLDDVSVIGSIPMVNLNTNRLYVVERTPREFAFDVQVRAAKDLVSPDLTTLQIQRANYTQEDLTQYKYQVDIPNTLHNKPGKLLFYPDDSECVWAGVLYHGTWDPDNLPADFEEVSAKFLYTTGVAKWSTRVGEYQYFSFGTDFQGANRKEILRILEFPVGEFEAQTFRDTLAAVLNDGAFEGTIPEGSGTKYLVEGTGSEIRVRTNETLSKFQDSFVILPEQFLSNVNNTVFSLRSGHQKIPRASTASLAILGSGTDAPTTTAGSQTWLVFG